MINKLLLLAVAVVATTSFSSALAQRGNAPPGAGDKSMRDGADSVRDRSNEMERVHRDSEKPDRKSSEKSPEDKFPQIKEDFERIQLINGDVLQSAAPGGVLDYGRLSGAAEEMSRRATRLKSNLFPPESAKKSKPKGEAEKDQRDLKALLSALDGAIARFVSSPIFQNVKIVNPQDSAQASVDLTEVIKLSARIATEAGKLKKTDGN